MNRDNPNPAAPPTPQWASASGDAWARRWRNTDAALDPISPYLLAAIAATTPVGRFRAFEIGCGPGSTTIAVADAFPEARITACDISPSLAAIASERLAGDDDVRVLVADAEIAAASEGPFDLLFSRHGVMFFADPVRAFTALRNASDLGGALIFSCFQAWDLNPWASELAAAAAGRELPRPGREPSGFAFADRAYVREILGSSGWHEAEPQAISFRYFAGHDPDEAMAFLLDIGPASRIIESMPAADRAAAIGRMRKVIDLHFDGTAVEFPAAAWVWQATAG
jgi:SAM-dependent methyltransferase